MPVFRRREDEGDELAKDKVLVARQVKETSRQKVVLSKSN